MASEIKYLIFKGVSKKEQILLKSYLNLAKHELPYQIFVLKKEAQESGEPDFLIADELYQFKDDEQYLLRLPQIVVGQTADGNNANFLSRPIRWSDFKKSLARLNLDVVTSTAEPEGDESDDVLFEPVLPANIKLSVDEASINQDPESQELVEEPEPEQDHEFELANFSVDYDSFTNSEYSHAVDDVNRFKEGEQTDEPVLLVTDEESSFTSSVLILESNAADMWDEDEVEDDYEFSQMIDSEFSESVSDSDAVVEAPKGVKVSADEPLWLEDAEFMVDGKAVLYVKKKRKMVYSLKPPGRWPEFLSQDDMFKLPLSTDWTPTAGLKAYPISYLQWTHELARNNEALDDTILPNDHYLLSNWPPFELLQLDNKLLKLATLTFVNPESFASLITKTNYKEADIIGFMNACHSFGILRQSYEIDQSAGVGDLPKGSVLNKIKKVFK